MEASGGMRTVGPSKSTPPLGAPPDGVDGVQAWKKSKGARRVEGAWHPSP